MDAPIVRRDPRGLSGVCLCRPKSGQPRRWRGLTGPGRRVRRGGAAVFTLRRNEIGVGAGRGRRAVRGAPLPALRPTPVRSRCAATIPAAPTPAGRSSCGRPGCSSRRRPRSRCLRCPPHSLCAMTVSAAIAAAACTALSPTIAVSAHPASVVRTLDNASRKPIAASAAVTSVWGLCWAAGRKRRTARPVRRTGRSSRCHRRRRQPGRS